ncbi:hypothetical protein [Microbulbifer sp. YPW1]|uniref:hypothetical protein n=1 Tax=Microbulbifer sp. YPW1 TaxID=2745199 RepID=UPI0015985C72|nr:hypothetical protein [Microbulbifer sp. YPW1]QKX17830.1 hypothetical protein HUW35_13065 [Microbulbifer sp. YPW1]
MFRPLLIAALLTSFTIAGCSRQSDTNDPDKAPETETEVIEEITVDEPADDSASSPESDSSSGESPNSEGQLICNAEWFEWVNGQLVEKYGEAIAEQYPDGMPSVGSQEWFMAADKLTGGDGAHGPDGGSDEWCFMMQQRLGTGD